MPHIELKELYSLSEQALIGIDAGPSLETCDAALIWFGLVSSVTALASDAIEEAIAAALHHGASPEQLQEVVSLVSGLGVHSLMATAVRLARAAGIDTRALSPEEQALWDRHVGDDPFWAGFERELPGFLGAMLRLSSDQFVAFFEYCAVPWKNGAVRGRLKELIAMACDATPGHRFLPGFRLHLTNAVALGVGRAQIMETLALAARVPLHEGMR